MASSRDLLSQFRGLTLDNVGSWPMVPRVALWLFIVAAFAVGGWFALWSGQKDQLEQLQAEGSLGAFAAVRACNVLEGVCGANGAIRHER